MPENKKLPTKPSRVCYIGDSHSVMSMGRNLLEVWQKRSPESFQQLSFYAVSGSTFQDWQTGRLQHLRIKNLRKEPLSQTLLEPEVLGTSLAEILEKEKPQLLILALGTNDLLKFQAHFESYLLDLQRQLKALSQLFGIPFLWVMPPVLAKDLDPGQMRAKLLNGLRSLSFVELIDIDRIFPDQKDGYHFHKDRALEFSQELIDQLIRKKVF